jgi:hypothetical protein
LGKLLSSFFLFNIDQMFLTFERGGVKFNDRFILGEVRCGLCLDAGELVLLREFLFSFFLNFIIGLGSR